MSRIDRAAAAIAAILQPLTGGRGTGSAVLQTVDGYPDATVPRNTYLVPVIEGAEDPKLLLKTGAGPNADSSWTIDALGTQVTVISNLGGLDHDAILPGTELRVLDPPEGVSDVGFINPSFAGATAPPAEPAARLERIAVYDRQGFPIAVDFFRAQVDRFPAAIIVWEGRELADAATTPALDYSATVGRDTKLYSERFSVVLFCSRLEGLSIRRGELHRLTDAVFDVLSGRRAVDGQVFSSPGSLVIHEVVPENAPDQLAYQNVMGARLRLSISQAVRRCDTRVYSPWLLTRIDGEKPETNEPTDPESLTVEENYLFEMEGHSLIEPAGIASAEAFGTPTVT